MIRHRRPRDPRRMDGLDRDDFWQLHLHSPPQSRTATFSLSGAPCILNCQITATTCSLQYITQTSLLNLASTFALSYIGEVTMFMVTPFTVSICGDVQCYWAQVVLLHSLWPLHTRPYSLNIVCAPLPSWHKLFISWSILLTHSCTDKFSLCHHPGLPLYTVL